MFRVKRTFSFETHDPLLAAVAPTGHLYCERSIGGDDGAHLMMVVIVMVMMVMVMMVMMMVMVLTTSVEEMNFSSVMTPANSPSLLDNS